MSVDRLDCCFIDSGVAEGSAVVEDEEATKDEDVAEDEDVMESEGVTESEDVMDGEDIMEDEAIKGVADVPICIFVGVFVVIVLEPCAVVENGLIGLSMLAPWVLTVRVIVVVNRIYSVVFSVGSGLRAGAVNSITVTDERFRKGEPEK